MSRRIKLFVGAGVAIMLVGVLAVGLLGSGIVFAQTPPSGTTPPSPGTQIQDFLGKLAANLGISTDTLTSAIKKTENQLVDQAQQQGKITQTQANNLHQRINNNTNNSGPGLFFGLRGLNGNFGMGRWGHGRFGEAAGIGFGRGQVISDTAQLIGMNVSDIQTQLRSGKSLAEIAASAPKPLQRQDLINALVKQISANIQQAVTNGKLTQSQATNITNGLPTVVGRMVDAKFTGGRFPRANGQQGSPGSSAPSGQRFMGRGMPFRRGA